MKRIRKILIRVLRKILNHLAYIDYVKNFNDRSANSLKKVKDRRTLTPDQKEEVLSFYKDLTDKKVSLIDHEYFYSRTGVYSKEYMPIGLYEAEIMGRANRLDMAVAYSDKSLNPILFPNVRQPHILLKNRNGYYYYEDKPVSLQEAVILCSDLGDVIIKPSMSMKGSGVRRVCIKNGICNDGSYVTELFESYKQDFLIQDVVKQHALMSALNPTSINTIRILTYRSGMEIIVIYTVVRIGRQGQVIDNQSAGGMSAVIHPDGTLGKYAFGVAGDDLIEKTDSGVVLEGYKIPSYQETIDTVKRLHYNLPFFNLIGWDMAICEDGIPLLVEWNQRPGPSQTACGTGFGKYTERIIKEVKDKKNTQII